MSRILLKSVRIILNVYLFVVVSNKILIIETYREGT